MASDDHQPLVPKVGEKVGRYQIVSELGRGGMGTVYRARDSTLGRDVALKCPWPEFLREGKHRRRFLREARAASRLSHPNIVQVFEVFKDRGLPWVAMQLIEGVSLAQRIDTDGALSVDEVLRYAEELVLAVQCAHNEGILHRDLSPKNVMLSDDGRALLTDFGLARFLGVAPADSADETETWVATTQGKVVGTPRYMSPEQVLAKTLDVRSDVFAIGAVLYEMCTGEPAFPESDRGKLLDSIMHREPAAISRFTYEVPEELERITRKALAKVPGERYQRTDDLLADLRALRRRQQSASYEQTRSSSAPSTKRNRKLLMIAGGITLGVIVAGLLFYRARDRPIPRADSIQVTSAEAWHSHPAISPDGSRVAFASDETGSRDIYVVDARGGTPLRLTTDEGVDSEPAWFPDGSAIAFASDRAGRTAIWKIGQLGGDPTLLVPDANHPAISPDGSRVAFVRSDTDGVERVHVAPLDDIENATLLTGPRDGSWFHWHPAWSPDGKTLCYSARENLWLVEVAGGRPRQLTKDGELDMEPEWSPDGRHVYFASHREGTLAIWRVKASGGKPERVTLGTGQESHPSISRDGARLTYSTKGADHDLVLLEVDSAQTLRLPGSRGDLFPSISRNGSRIAFASDRWAGRFQVWVQDLENGRPSGQARRLTEHPGDATFPVISPDGEWIAYYRISETQRDIWIIPAAGGRPRQITSDPAGDIHATWAPDGTQLAFSSDRSGTWQVWRLEIDEGEPASEPRRLTERESVAFAPAWSPDGAWIAYVNTEGDESDVWLVAADGTLEPRPITNGAGARRVQWDAVTGDLLVSAKWTGDGVTLERVSVEGERRGPFEPPVDFGQDSLYAGFDLSTDGSVMVYCSETLGGNIWGLEALSGRY